jgi:hypothetical protein
MRLINMKTYEIEEFFATQAPKYYALSHTWLAAGEEVSLRDWQTALQDAKAAPPSVPTDITFWIGQRMRISLEKLDKAQGFEKIQGCMRKASRNVDFCWVDTVCIDKSSSAELSESINCMYRIYRDCEICIAYLVDTQKKPFPGVSQVHLVRSRWFTRGWTVGLFTLCRLLRHVVSLLPELIAPKVVIFYDCDWHRLGDKSSLRRGIATETGIDEDCLNSGDVGRKSVAQRMSWAAKRNTTREEDIAYCLLGIFDINMPLLYGEGTKAFTRLQEEIIRKYDDDSIFAWASPPGPFPGGTYRSLLARSPSEFMGSGKIIFPASRHSEPFSVTNKGLRVQFSGQTDPNYPVAYVVILECITKVEPPPSDHDAYLNVKIRLRELSSDSSQYVRVESHELISPEMRLRYSIPMDVRNIFVRDHPIVSADHVSPRFLGICFDLHD